MKETIARLREMRDTWSVDNMYEALRALPKLLDYIEELQRDQLTWSREALEHAQKLEKDNALLREVAKASIRMWNGGWDKEHQREIENIYSTALKAAEAAMETKPESLYPSNDVIYTKGEG